jgi:hypothetical protein
MILCTLIAASACSASRESDSADAGGAGGAGSAETSSAGDGGSSGLAGGPGQGGSSAECKDVDVLFVVDDSGSMGDNQKSLIASFPGFVAGIQQKLTHAPSYHVGVVTVDDYYSNDPACTAIGSLVTKTGGPESSNKACAPFASGAHFMDATEPDLAAKFACAAQVGAGGSDDERPMRALLDALKPETNAPGACNAGFARADSLLVIVIITDEDDTPDGCDPSTGMCMTYGSGGTPDDWFAELSGYRGGLTENIIVLSLLGKKLDNTCGAQPASKLIGFTNKFGKNGLTGDVCSSTYDDFFTQALPVIDEGCANIAPPK